MIIFDSCSLKRLHHPRDSQTSPRFPPELLQSFTSGHFLVVLVWLAVTQTWGHIGGIATLQEVKRQKMVQHLNVRKNKRYKMGLLWFIEHVCELSLQGLYGLCVSFFIQFLWGIYICIIYYIIFVISLLCWFLMPYCKALWAAFKINQNVIIIMRTLRMR